MSEAADFDVVVAGAGPAGCTAARALSEAGWQTLVVDRQRRPSPPRAETLPAAARPLLERLGLLEEVERGPHPRTRARRSCWGAAEPSERPSLLDPYGEGWHLDRGHFDAILREGAEAAGASFVRERVRAVREERSAIAVDLGCGAALQTRAIVDATGRSAGVARHFGAELRPVDRLVAACGVGGRAAEQGDDGGVGLVEASADGWWYSAPLPDGRYALQFVTSAAIWSAGRSLAERLPSTAHTRRRVDAPASPAVVTVARSAWLSPSAGPGWIAVGDAAASHDPLAAAGLTMALRSGLRGAQALAAWLRDGDGAGLRTYAQMQEAAFASYCAERSALYSSERRWPGEPFWAEARTTTFAPARRAPGNR